MNPPTAAELVSSLGLAPHPEGGFYREVFRDPARVLHPAKGVWRSAVTCISFLLEEGTFSAFHRVAQTELWHHLAGAPLELHVLRDDGAHEQIILGSEVPAGQVPQHAVPAFAWQAARPLGAYSLCGCTVAPGFDFDDFELPSRDALVARLPGHRALIERFTRGP